MVKLTRAFWIIPVALATALTCRCTSRITIPWFVFLFCIVAALNTWFTRFTPLFNTIQHAAHIGLAVTRFLIGTGIGLRTLRQAGGRIMVQGVVLWAIVAGASLFAVYRGWIAI